MSYYPPGVTDKMIDEHFAKSEDEYLEEAHEEFLRETEQERITDDFLFERDFNE